MIDQTDARTLPNFADQIAFVDVVEVANRIVTQRARGAIGASTIEIAALAHRVVQLTALAELTYGLLSSADVAMAEQHPDMRRRLRHAVSLKISDVGAALEALGYGATQPTTTTTTTTEEDKTDGTTN